MRALTITAPAKINLFLGVGRLRPDGYHAVNTVMHTLTLADTVRLTPADALTLTCDTDLAVPAESNLAFKAAETFAETYDIDVLTHIEVVKRIPSGAGFGGGSSDASAVLAGLAHWAGLPLDDPRLVAAARSLGTDCAFLLTGGAAVMRGRGDRTARRLPAIDADVVLVKPSASVATAEAYRSFDAAPPPVGDMRPVTDALCFRDVRALAAGLANNMTTASSSLVPEVAEALAWVSVQRGVLGSAMAGSGSGAFAICEDSESAARIADEAGLRGWWGAATKTGSDGVTVADEGESA